MDEGKLESLFCRRSFTNLVNGGLNGVFVLWEWEFLDCSSSFLETNDSVRRTETIRVCQAG